MSKQVFIRRVEYLSKDAEEAIVHITDGEYECIAFCQPCERNSGEPVNQPLLAFESKGIVSAHESKFYLRRAESTFGYNVCRSH